MDLKHWEENTGHRHITQKVAPLLTGTARTQSYSVWCNSKTIWSGMSRSECQKWRYGGCTTQMSVSRSILFLTGLRWTSLACLA